jgi:hypothetical protein
LGCALYIKCALSIEKYSNPKIRQALITNESENPAGHSIFHLAFRGRDADEVALENPNTVSAS